MIVVGGCYTERCSLPNVAELLGSGGRAALYLASGGIDTQLYTYCADGMAPGLEASVGLPGVSLTPFRSKQHIVFQYLHPLARPIIHPWPLTKAKPFDVAGPKVLRFGMIEGDAKVKADIAVYDPQSAKPFYFTQNGSEAARLAVVCNTDQLRSYFPRSTSEVDAIGQLFATDNAEVIVLKDGAVGARVYERDALVSNIPPYWTSSVYKVGSGDIFSAAFALAWMQRGEPADRAADFASRSAAIYCDRHSLNQPSAKDLAALAPIVRQRTGLVYIAAPFFNVADLWLVEELWRALTAVGAIPFSPLHEVGRGPAHVVAKSDLDALARSTAVLAVVSGSDPGTLFEVGCARSLGIPVVALAQNARPADATMLEGTDCVVTSEVATAVYQAAWLSWR